MLNDGAIVLVGTYAHTGDEWFKLVCDHLGWPFRAEYAAAPDVADQPALLRPLVRAARYKAIARELQERIGKPRGVVASDLNLGLNIVSRMKLECPVLAFSQGSDVMVVPHESARQARLARKMLESVDGTVANTNYHAAFVRDFDPLHRQPFVRGPWIADDWIAAPGTSDARRVAARNVLHLPQDAFVFFAPRGTRPLYRPEVLLKAFGLVVREVPSAQLAMRVDIAGEAACWMKGASQAGIPESQIRLLPEKLSRDEMRTWFDASSVMAQALERESLGLTGLEAMARGRVIVQPRSGLADELYPVPQRELLASDESDESLAQAMVRATSPEQRAAAERTATEEANLRHARETCAASVVIPTRAEEFKALISLL